MRFGLSDETINKISSVFNKYQAIEEAIIYGSRAKGDFREGSDIDLTLKGEKITSEILLSIKNDMDEINTPYLFDISIYQLITSNDLKEHINRAGIIFYKKES